MAWVIWDNGDAQGVDPLHVDFDVDLALQAADDVDGADAVDLLDLGPDAVFDERADLGQAPAGRRGSGRRRS